MYRLEDTYWWFVGRRRIMRGMLSALPAAGSDASILDVGCGTGGNHSLLSEFGAPVSCDISEHALSYCRKRGAKRLVAGSAERLPLRDSSFHYAACLEVLEHLDDDRAGMRELFRVIRPGGYALVAVPAYQWLWSEHDEALHHRRRYSAQRLKDIAREAGFRVTRVTHCVTFLLPAIAVFRLGQRLVGGFKRRSPRVAYLVPPRWLNQVFVSLLHLEACLLGRLNLPLGVTIVCLLEKPHSPEA